MFDVAIITAIYDNYDSLKPVRKQINLDVEWVVVTDNPKLDIEGWEVIYEPNRDRHPNIAAKRPKLMPWNYTDAPASIWIDASFRVVNEMFACEAMRYAEPIAQFKHPWRDCVYTETIASEDIPKYAGEPIAEQARQYRMAGFPENFGLWATGVIARQHTNNEIKRLGRVWAGEIFNWSFQDQLSEPYAMWLSNMRPAEFPGTHFANNWLVYEGSGRH